MRAEEYVVEELLKLKEENEGLKQQLSMYEDLEKVQDENIEFWKNKYYELVGKLKEKCNPKIRTDSYDNMEQIDFISFTVYNGYGKEEEYEYFKNLLNLDLFNLT